MRYVPVQPLSLSLAKVLVTNSDPVIVSDAIRRIGVSYLDPEWTNDTLVAALDRSGVEIRSAVLFAVAALARANFPLERSRFYSAVVELSNDPDLGGLASDALDDFEIFLGWLRE